MADRSDAHYLHAAKALELVLTPHLAHPRAMSWAPGKELLLVAGEEGLVHSVEPSYGTRELFRGPIRPVHLACGPEHLAVLSEGGRIEVRRQGEAQPEYTLEVPFTGARGLRFWAGGLAAIGDTPEGRVVWVWEEQQLKWQQPVPPGTALGVDEAGLLSVGRVTEAEASIVPLGSPLPEGVPTGHQLRFTPGGFLLGVAPGGATLWGKGLARSVRMLDTVAAALARNGRTLAIGTRGGDVALADIEGTPAERAHPPRVNGHESPVSTLSFSSRGRWLASLAENCRLWAY